MSIELGYLGIEASDLEAWRHFSNMHGLMEGEPRPDGTLAFRNDDHASRFLISQAAKARDVEHFYRFRDPNGIAFEMAMGARTAATPFKSQYIPAFLTGEQGLGHVVVVTEKYAESEDFMRHVLGGKVTDYIIQPLTPEVDGKIGFIRTNTRHHSIGYAEGFRMPRKMHHFMLQVPSIDEVGTTYDRVRASGIHMNQTIGQHPNDRMVSFYSETPSGFYVEFGALGISIPDDHGEPGEVFDKFSTWGHEFQKKQGVAA